MIRRARLVASKSKLVSKASRRIFIFDTTLRDGAQTQGVDFSLSDKRALAEALDSLGVDYIEGGWPGSNPTDDAFFCEPLGLETASFVAFGMTRRAGVSTDNDAGLSSLVNSVADSACIVGKAWDSQVELALQVSLDENLSMIGDSIVRLAGAKNEAMFDAEHFFDGYKSSRDYAFSCLETALDAGARWVVLCDTRGGAMPAEVFEISQEVCKRFGGDRIGIHAHNDTENAVANSLAAVEAGVCQVQGTINGLGERCGNANLISLLPNLSLKLGYDIGVCANNMANLLSLSRLLDERLGWVPRRQMAYVGSSAFAHKGGLHASAVAKDPTTYEHISPESVGNDRVIVMSNQAGMTNVVLHLRKLGIAMPDKERLQSFLSLVKLREHDGFSYDGADASFELLARGHMGPLSDFFEILRFRVIDERRRNAVGTFINESEATVQVRVGSEDVMRVAMGNGPVHAFDRALRASLIEVFPSLEPIELIDYKVRIIPPHVDERGTAAITRVLLESTDGTGFCWSTVGVSTNIIDASAMALYDSYAYRLLKEQDKA